MEDLSKIWYLSHFNLAKRLKRSELMYMCDNSIMKKYSVDDTLIESFDENRNIYFLKKGTLKITRVNAEHDELLTYLVPQWSIFGITQFLTDNYDGNEILTAMKDCTVCKVSMNIFRELMESNADLNNFVLKLSGFRIKKLENKLENVLFKSAETRVREFLIDFPKEYGQDNGSYYQAELFLKNKDIASLTNSSRQKVNKVMNEMKRDGIIDYDNNYIKYYKS